MSARQQVLSLAGLLLLACVVLAGLAWRTVSDESSRAEARYRQRAEGALDAAERALKEAVLRSAKASGVAITSEAQTQAPSTRPGSAWEAMDLRTSDLVRDQGPAAAETALLAFAERSQQAAPADAAAALNAAALLAQKAGRREAAAARWERMLELARGDAEPGGPLCDQRGLRSTWLARYQLALQADEGERVDALLSLLEDLSGAKDPGPRLAPAQGVLRRRVVAHLRKAALSSEASARLERLLAADAEHDLRRRLQSYADVTEIRAWSQTASTLRAFDLPADPTRGQPPYGERRVLVVPASLLQLADTGATARAVSLATALKAALGSSELAAYREVGFEVRANLFGQPPSSEPSPPLVAQRDLAGLFRGVHVDVHGSERDAFVAAETRRLHQTLGLIVGALALLALGSAFVLRSLFREAETARAQRNFVAAVTHELKSPLASIRLLGELLAEGGVEREQAEAFARRVVGEADRLTGLVSAVLDLTRAERGLDPNLLTRVAPRELADDAFERTRLPAEEAGATLELHVAEGAAPLLGDREGLVSVLVNLLDNSLKYADLSEPIELRVEQVGERVRFRVLDRGAGVPGPERERIFEPFWRVQDEMTRERPGVGLGLALGRSLAEAHGGELRYEVRDGGGSEFVLELPAERGA